MCVCVTRGFCRKQNSNSIQLVATAAANVPSAFREAQSKLLGSTLMEWTVKSVERPGLHRNQETKNNHRKTLISIQCVAHGDSNWDLYSSEILQLQEISETSVPPASSSPNSVFLRSYWTLLSSDASGKQSSAQF